MRSSTTHSVRRIAVGALFVPLALSACATSAPPPSAESGAAEPIASLSSTSRYATSPAYYQYVGSTRWEINSATPANERCGSRALIQSTYDVATRWHQAHPSTPLRLGDMNAAGHASHKNGVDVDVFGVGNAVGYVGSANFARNVELGKMFVDTGIIKTIFFNDPSVRSAVNAYAGRTVMEYWAGHENHFHVRIADSFRLSSIAGCPSGVTQLPAARSQDTRPDFNGDGRTDIIGRNGTDVQVALSNGGGFNGSSRWTTWSTAYSLSTGDFNGDGRTDIIGRNGTDVQVALSNGGGFNGSTRWTPWSTAYTLEPGDYNGDGTTDLFGRNASTGDIQVALSNGGGFNGSTRWGFWSSTYTLGRADVNGDGRLDLVGRRKSDGDVQVSLSNGGGFNGSTRWGFWSSTYTLGTGDYNGDGRADLIGRRGTDVQVSLSNGGSFNGSTRWTTWGTAYSMGIGDYNGDGRADLIGRAGIDVQVSLSNGAGLSGSTRWTTWGTAYSMGTGNQLGL